MEFAYIEKYHSHFAGLWTIEWLTIVEFCRIIKFNGNEKT